MQINVVITGSTGMVGKGVLMECLKDARISRVLVVNRSPLEMEHPKLTEVLTDDFYDDSTYKEYLNDCHACFFCLGVSAFRKSEEEYSRITYDLTVTFAKAFLEQNPDSIFCYVSGAGTDSTENGRIMWARVKGRTENALLAMPFRAAYMFRPGYIQPMDGIKSKTPIYNLAYVFAKPLYGLFKQFPNAATSTRNVGNAMIEVAIRGADQSVLSNKDINDLAERRV